jgi:AraC-like DNA-binding protein
MTRRVEENAALVPIDVCQMQHSFWRAIERMDLDPSRLLKRAGLPVTPHKRERQFLTTAQFFQLWTALAELGNDPALWLRFVNATAAGEHQPLFVAACYSATYGEGLARIAYFKRFCTPEQFHIEIGSSEVSIWTEWFYATAPEPTLSVDVSFAFLLALGRRGTGRDLAPIRIELTREGPESQAMRDHFRCPVHYGAKRNTLVLHARDLALPFPAHNPELIAILTPALTNALGNYHPTTPIAEQVQAALRPALAIGRSDLTAVASNLGVSERTLQRRMTDDGVTFRSLVTAVRRDMAGTLLSNSSTTIGGVAAALGFQNVSSFYRAFKEWEGMTPQQWRAHHGAAATAVKPS